MNGKRSNYDQLFITGRRCFYVDPCQDHRIDYFYSWESVSCGLLGSLYVWCRNQLLYSYQKFIIFILAALLFTFPVYAEDERYEFQSIQNEALYLQGYDLNEYYDSLESESNNLLLSSSDEPYNTLSNDYRFILLDYMARIDESNTLQGKFNYSGDKPITFSIYRSANGSTYRWVDYNADLSIFDDYIYAPFQSSASRLSITSVRYKFNSDDDYIVEDIEDISFDRSSLSSEWQNIVTFIGGKMTAYLEQVATVFTWILTHITELITFILGNPFLAVSLVLFMCGAVISFYVRIKNS